MQGFIPFRRRRPKTLSPGWDVPWTVEAVALERAEKLFLEDEGDDVGAFEANVGRILRGEPLSTAVPKAVPRAVPKAVSAGVPTGNYSYRLERPSWVREAIARDLELLAE